jgi:diacylglycerol kinase family enzyme
MAMDFEESSVICLSLNGNQILAVETEQSIDQIPMLKKISLGTSDTTFNKFRSTIENKRNSQNTAVPSPLSKIYVLVSILSGTQLAKQFFESTVQPLLTELGLEGNYEVEYTKNANTIIDFTKSVISKNAMQGISQLVMVLSGDGGIVDILNALEDPIDSSKFIPPQISLIPMGTGNALANSSGILSDKTIGLSTFARGTPHNLPIFRATFSLGARLLVDEARKEEELPLKDADGNSFMYGAVVCSWGLHAGLVADSDTTEYRKFGVDRFKMAAGEALFPKDGSDPHHYKAKLSILGRGASQWRDLDRTEHAYVLVTLVSSLEKSFTISPHSKPLNDVLRIIHFGPRPGNEVMRLMKLAYQGGKHIDDESVSYEEVEAVRINFESRESEDRWRRICLDGKIVLVEADGWVEIREEKKTLLQLRHLK